MTRPAGPPDGPSRKEQIVEQARDLFLDEGPEGLSMRKVAARVGVSATAIYRHFADKDALVAAVVEEGFRLFGTYLFQALQAAGPRERLLATGERYLDFAFEHPQDYRVIFLSWHRMRPDRARMEQHQGPPPTMRFLLDRVREVKGDLPPEALFSHALQLWAVCHGLASLWLTGGAQGQVPQPAYRALATQVLRREVDALLP